MTRKLEEGFSGLKVLITGGLGFIGSNLARRLVDCGAEVLLIDNLDPRCGGNPFNIAGIEDRVRVSTSDVGDERSLGDLVQDRDCVFNLAGRTSHLDSMQDPYSDLNINCRAQLCILEACRKRNPQVKIVFASTRQIYGKPDYLPVDERHPPRPVDVNGINKMAAERYHILYNEVYGIRACVLRLTNTYGPRMRVKDAAQMFLGGWIRLLIEGEVLQVYGDGTQLRDFNYVDDAVEAFLLAAASEKANGEVFNLGSDGSISLRELAELLIELHGGGDYRLVPYPPERKAIEIGNYSGSYDKIHTTLGWRPKVSLRDGLARTLAYYREHHSRYFQPGGS